VVVVVVVVERRLILSDLSGAKISDYITIIRRIKKVSRFSKKRGGESEINKTTQVNLIERRDKKRMGNINVY
jgi:hypothetical protein